MRWHEDEGPAQPGFEPGTTLSMEEPCYQLSIIYCDDFRLLFLWWWHCYIMSTSSQAPTCPLPSLFCPNKKLHKAQCTMHLDKVCINFWIWSSSRSNLIALLYTCKSKSQPAACSLVLIPTQLAYSAGPVLFRAKMTHSLSVWVYDNWLAKR